MTIAERGAELTGHAVERGGKLRDRTVDTAERAREAVGQVPTDRWATLACAGLALLTMVVIVRRVRAS